MPQAYYQFGNTVKRFLLPDRCIYLNGNHGFNVSVRGISEIRRINLSSLIEDAFHGSQTKFAEAMGYSQPSLVSRYTSGSPGTTKPIGSRMARKIEATCGKPEFWMDHEHPTARQTGNHYNVTTGPAIVRTVPLISWVQAGDWHEAVTSFQPGKGDEWYPCPVTCSPDTFVLRVRGASMEPRFHDGELIFVDPRAEPRNRSFVVVRLDDQHEATFKQLIVEGGRRYLKPLNPQWPDPITEINGNATICGVVIFRGEEL